MISLTVMNIPANKKVLSHILNLDSVHSIYELIGRMEMLLQFFRQHKSYHPLIPFTHTYYLVTKKVALKNIQDQEYYQNFGEMQKMDIYFASLYFKALRSYLIKGELLTPWKTFFDYCSNTSGYPFVQMLLGINAHINGDLPVTLFQTEFSSKEDFLKINDILLEVIPDIMKFLAFAEKDIWGMGAVVLSSFVQSEFRASVVKWRNNAWDNFLILKAHSSSGQVLHLHQKTEQAAIELIDIMHVYKAVYLPSFVDRLELVNVSLGVS